MRIDIQAERDGCSVEERRVIERAVLMTLGRYRSRITQVVMSVEPAGDGPVADRRVAIRIEGSRRLLVLDSGHSLTAAATRALDRARRCLQRDLARFGWRRSAPAVLSSGADGWRMGHRHLSLVGHEESR